MQCSTICIIASKHDIALVTLGDDDFTPSLKWTGRKGGFEFKLGERGLGYYRTGQKVVVPSNVAYS